MIVPVMSISNLVLTQQIYSEETNSAHAHNHDRVPLKPLDIFMQFENTRKKCVCEKSSIEGAKEDVDKICIKVQKTSDNACGKPTLVSHFNKTHLVLWTTPKTLEPQ